MHVGDGKNRVVHAIDTEQRRAGSFQDSLSEKRWLGRVLDPFLAGRSVERARQSFGEFEWIFAALRLDDPIGPKGEMGRTALIHRRAQTLMMRVRNFGCPVTAGAAAVNPDSVRVEVGPARDVIKYRIPKSLGVLRSR